MLNLDIAKWLIIVAKQIVNFNKCLFLKVLFCNLMVSVISSTVDIIAFPLVGTDKYITIVRSNNAFCLIFHCSCWSILSGLRYLLIIQKSWVNSKYPNVTSLGQTAILAVFLLFFSCLGINILVSVGNGWPKIRIPEMPMWKKAISGAVLFGTYFLLIFLSCIFYAIIFNAKTKMSNKIAPELREGTTTLVKPISSQQNVSSAKEAQDFDFCYVSNHDLYMALCK